MPQCIIAVQAARLPKMRITTPEINIQFTAAGIAHIHR
ncbi:MAG: hypothetical protein GPOALKHO_001970 [Sodalis sp.]|nr:MAG: hypothetical protein GPOALKHO_001970 [Sodalis sp.]